MYLKPALSSRWRAVLAALAQLLNKPNGLLGREFFAAASKNQMSESLIREEHTNRVNLLIKDIMNKFGEKGISIKNLFIGGGNSRYLIFDKLKVNHSDIEIVEMTPPAMQKDQINSDLIPLLGLAKMLL